VEQTLCLYLNILNKIIIFFIFTFFILLTYIVSYLNINRDFEKNIIVINKGLSINKIVDLILVDEYFINKNIFFIYLKVFNKYNDTIKFGEFNIEKKSSLIEVGNIISKPSNVYRDFTIIGGWQKYQLEKLTNEKFNESYLIEYNKILADTYKYQLYDHFDEIYKLMKKNKDKFFAKHKDKELLKTYSIDEIMIIASLVEKEGKTEYDKRFISSVILNRLEKNLRLEIDATTIFAITKGKHKLNRKLTYKDLKIKNQYNTYFIKGLPPQPICYVSMKTIEILLENYKSDYLFYFYNENIENHVFSKTYQEHKKSLNKYRNSE